MARMWGITQNVSDGGEEESDDTGARGREWVLMGFE